VDLYHRRPAPPGGPPGHLHAMFEIERHGYFT
jgi:hypothetical protein